MIITPVPPPTQYEPAHEMGRNNLANKRALRLWQSAKNIVTRRHGLTIGAIKVEPDPGIAGALGMKSSVFAVAGHSNKHDVSGCFEVRVSQLTGGVRISPALFTGFDAYPEIPVKSAKTGEVPRALRQFVRALGRA
ncbi:MAG: hypothetical protein KBA75_01540 [Alphaproteobacteria bacterium]|nr:hypothetical protein [Alphaproteobacteria bacterium]